ncbi:MAG: Amuc_1100 family pilus-like protein [Chthoniobacterales bacterium]
MKKGFQQNRFLISYIVIVVIGIGGLGYFLYQSKSNFDVVMEEYQNAIRRLHTLQTLKPFPDDKNLKLIQGLQGQYKNEIMALAQDLKNKEIPLKEITPQAFQDRLRKIVSEVEKRASEQSVRLPATFYMGFDRYKDNLPQTHAAPALGRQLESITIVVNKLIDLRVHEIVTVGRKELPSEAITPVEAPQNVVVSLSPFDVVFISDQGKFRQVFNSILDMNQFFIIRSLTILNSKPMGPSRKDDRPEAAPTPIIPAAGPARSAQTTSAESHVATGISGLGTPSAENSSQVLINNDTPPPPSIRVVVGQETLTVALRIDQVNFEVPEIK